MPSLTPPPDELDLSEIHRRLSELRLPPTGQPGDKIDRVYTEQIDTLAQLLELHLALLRVIAEHTFTPMRYILPPDQEVTEQERCGWAIGPTPFANERRCLLPSGHEGNHHLLSN